MNRNQKIALGCGGAGCLGLIVVVVAGVALYLMSQSSSSRTVRNYNVNLNSNSSDRNSNNSNDDANTNTSSSSSSMSDDDRHKLFQAAGATSDSALIQRVLKKIGLVGENGVPTSDYAQFMKDHFAWALKNGDFIRSINTPEKARAYVDEHLD